MKRILLMLFLMFFITQGFAQPTQQLSFRQVELFNGLVTNSTALQGDTSISISMQRLEGISTLFIDFDTTGVATTGSNAADSCLAIGYQIYADGIGWCRYFDQSTTYNLIDTIPRTLNTGDNLWMNIPVEDDEWGIGDSVRFFMIHGIDDSANVILLLRAQ